MIQHMTKLGALLLVLATSSAVWADGNVQCPKHPKEEWRNHNELHQKLQSEGWQVRRMEKTPTCYEVYAKDPQGKRIEAFFDPKTFERVLAE
jgi:hypothetical protein